MVIPKILALVIMSLASSAVAPGLVAAGNVAVLMTADVDAYREALRGFKGTLKGHRVAAEYDMEGDLERGRKLLGEIQGKVKPDLILAVGIYALQVVIGQAPAVPVVYAMVMNPPSIVGPGVKNVTGASMNVPVDQTFRLLKQLGPQVRRVGVVFDKSRTGYLVKAAEVAAREEGLQLQTREVRSAKESIPALEALVDEGVDVFWIVPDETNLAPAVIQHMLLLSFRRKIPILGLSESQAQSGALLSLSLGSAEDIGRQAAELAGAVLGGKAPSDVPYTTARQVRLTVNLKTAQKLGLEVPRSLVATAQSVIQ